MPLCRTTRTRTTRRRCEARHSGHAEAAHSPQGTDPPSNQVPREMQTLHPHRSRASTIATFLVAAAFVTAAPSLRAADTFDAHGAVPLNATTVLGQAGDPARNRETALARSPMLRALSAFAPSNDGLSGRSSRAAAAQRDPSPFGYLEFDWDPNGPGGMPGFDSRPNLELSAADASTRN